MVGFSLISAPGLAFALPPGGPKKLGLPAPKSYNDGALCASMLLTCAAASGQGGVNTLVDGACIALLKAIAWLVLALYQLLD